SAAVLADTARRAAAQGGIPLPGDAAVVGAAGAGRRQEQAELEAALVEAGVARRVRVLADGEVALTTAFARGPGVLVNAGTGSIAYARAPDGEIHRAGGYGWQLGDEGGGYWLGRRALELAELVVMLGRHFPAPDPVPVAITGGLLLPQSPLTAALRQRLAAGFKRARLVPERIDAAMGALKLASEMT